MKSPTLSIMVDVNVLLDVALDRTPWAAPAAQLLSMCDRNAVRGYWCAASVDTIHFLARRELSNKRAIAIVRSINRILQIAPVDEVTISEALNYEWPDLEDAIVHASAKRVGATHLITRDAKGYRKATLTICDASTLLASLT